MEWDDRLEKEYLIEKVEKLEMRVKKLESIIERKENETKEEFNDEKLMEWINEIRQG